MIGNQSNASQGRMKHAFRRTALIGAFVLTTTIVASCSLVGDDLRVETAAAADSTTTTAVPHTKKSYAYEKAEIVPVAMKADVDSGSANPAYRGSAPYICSPSGFGQKSRCFLRP
jgi:hypothetical protein